PAVAAVLVPHSIQDGKRLAVLPCGSERVRDELPVVRMDRARPAVAREGLTVFAGEGDPLVVDERAGAARIARPEQSRDGIGKPTYFLVLLARRALRCAKLTGFALEPAVLGACAPSVRLGPLSASARR